MAYCSEKEIELKDKIIKDLHSHVANLEIKNSDLGRRLSESEIERKNHEAIIIELRE